ncbi:MAG: FG-GAP repeat protein [Planctomycetes bacterium]|nr:FG-GAP repeat protein [Planctomycetota bacterium]
MRSLLVLSAFLLLPRAVPGGDFDGDGFDDLIAVASGATVFIPSDGAYFVLRGAANGLDGSSGFEQGVDAGVPVPNVGWDVGVGDFDGDGLSDLALSIIGATVDSIPEAGEVLIRYGTDSGAVFDPARDFILHQNVLGVAGEAGIHVDSPTQEAFGLQLVVGDFDGNKCSDLAVTVWDTVDSQPRAGAVHVFYGKKKVGLTTKKSQYWSQNSKGIASVALANEGFGSRLCVGDFNGDKRDDLVIMVKDHDEIDTRAALHVLFGSKRGLTAKKSLRIDDLALQLPQPVTPWIKSFVEGIGAGDFNGDGKDELVVGVPGEAIDGTAFGTLHLLPGTKKGPDPKQRLVYSQATPGVLGTAEAGDGFGRAFATGDFNGDGIDDLAIGIPGDSDIDEPDSGAVAILFGNEIGLIGAGAQFLHQNILSVGAVEEDDLFGHALATGDFDGDGYDDIAVGAPGEDIGAFTGCGMVDVFYGGPTGFPFAPPDHHYRGNGEMPGPTVLGDMLGWHLGS